MSSSTAMRTRVFYIRDDLLAAGYNPQHEVKAGDYRYACTILAVDPEDAFVKLNRGSGQEVAQLDLMELRSLSVGDIVYMNDIYYLCQVAGWKPLIPTLALSELYLKAVVFERDR